jgi:hypothetical protein
MKIIVIKTNGEPSEYQSKTLSIEKVPEQNLALNIIDEAVSIPLNEEIEQVKIE